MPRLAANLSMMVTGVGILDRFDAATRAGFAGVEFLFPYKHPAALLQGRLAANGLRQVLFNTPPGDWASGERGIYHCPVTEGDITRRLEAHPPIIAHMRVADVPARNEPGAGEIGWDHVFRRIDALGYDGWVGCEDRPAGDTVVGLAGGIRCPSAPGSRLCRQAPPARLAEMCGRGRRRAAIRVDFRKNRK